MISVCKDKFAFYDKESDAIVYKNSQGKRSLSLGGKVLTSLCVTDDRLHFIIDNLYVRGKLDEGVYRSVDNLRLEGKNWVKIFYIKRDNVEGLTLLSHNKETDCHEIFVQDEKENWMDISPQESNIVQSIPEFEFESRMTYFVGNAGKYYYGVFDPVSKVAVWKNIQLPPDLKISRITLSKDYIFFMTFDDDTKAICLYKTDVKLLLTDKENATKLVFENYAVILDLHSCKDFEVFLTPEFLILSKDDKLYSTEVQNLEEGDYMLEMKGLNGDLILRSEKGHIFKARLEDDTLCTRKIK